MNDFRFSHMENFTPFFFVLKSPAQPSPASLAAWAVMSEGKVVGSGMFHGS